VPGTLIVMIVGYDEVALYGLRGRIAVVEITTFMTKVQFK